MNSADKIPRPLSVPIRQKAGAEKISCSLTNIKKIYFAINLYKKIFDICYNIIHGKKL